MIKLLYIVRDISTIDACVCRSYKLAFTLASYALDFSVPCPSPCFNCKLASLSSFPLNDFQLGT
jgi:hypothetical protein